MTWQFVDDGWTDHDKFMLLESAEQIALWSVASNMCAAVNSDGVVTAPRLKMALFKARVTPDKKDETIAGLVAAGFWHDKKTLARCERCKAAVKDLPAKKLLEGEYLFHDWLDWNKSKAAKKDPDVDWREARRKHLHRSCKAEKQIVYNRDRGHCRYCGRRVTEVAGDTRSDWRITWDHVDPNCTDGKGSVNGGPGYGNTVENLVIAHAWCNAQKGRQTPAEARMPLLPVPTFDPATGSVSYDIPDPFRLPPPPGPDPFQAGSQTATTLDTPSEQGLHADVPDPARNGSGAGSENQALASDPGHGSDGPGTGSEGTGSERQGAAGRGRDGPGGGAAPDPPPDPDPPPQPSASTHPPGREPSHHPPRDQIEERDP